VLARLTAFRISGATGWFVTSATLGGGALGRRSRIAFHALASRAMTEPSFAFLLPALA
jgi:hypothetical protein